MREPLRFKKCLVIVLCLLPCVTIYYYTQSNNLIQETASQHVRGNRFNDWESSTSIESVKHELSRSHLENDIHAKARIDLINDHEIAENRFPLKTGNAKVDNQSDAEIEKNEQLEQNKLDYRKPPQRVSHKSHSERSLKRGPQEKLIILTYMRSGSSLTGDLFQQSEGVFYLYEPLWYTAMIWEGLVNTTALRFLNGSWYRVTNTTESRYERELQILRHVLSCNLTYLDYGTLKQLHMFNSVSTHNYARCVYHYTDKLHIEKCLQETVEECLNSTAIVAKIVRGSMRQVYELMKNDPSVKVLHLLRDPRGSLKSLYDVGMFNWSTLEETSYKYCHRVQQDLELSKIIAADFPGRLFTLRYEDLIQHPISAMQQLYDFLHLTLWQEIKDYIWNITYAGKPDDCNICTTRSNATETAYSWRRRLSFESIALIQSQCSELLFALGYRLFHDYDEKLNESISTKYNISERDHKTD